MRTRVLAPTYLTPGVAKDAIKLAKEAVMGNSNIASRLKRRHFYVVVLVPQPVLHDSRTNRDGDMIIGSESGRSTEPKIIYEESVTLDAQTWEYPYDQIARSKAWQLWEGRNQDGACSIMPHLLCEGDTLFWGGVSRHGIVVSCSGLQPEFDQLVSGIVADAIKAYCSNEHAQAITDDEQCFIPYKKIE